jgi:hypothetical protein
MTKRQALAIRTEEYVRKVVTQTFGQKANEKTIKTAAQKVIRAIPKTEERMKEPA